VKSRAAIGIHPIHPALVCIPIGGFFMAFLGDVVHAVGGSEFWYRLSYVCIGVGVLAALAAAVFGFIDYFGVRMSRAAGRLATVHMILNLAVVALYAATFLLRRNDGALRTSRWPLAFGIELVAFAALGVSGWIGGKLSFEHKVGVVEWTDPEANEIGQRESGASRAS